MMDFRHAKSLSTVIGIHDFEKKSLIQWEKANCDDGHEVVYQNTKGELHKINGFSLNENRSEGIAFGDGSKLLIMGWMNIPKVDGKFQIYEIPFEFGFCYGIGKYSLDASKKICDQWKLDRCKKVEESYLIDNNKNIIYLVKEYIFDEVAASFDLFNGQKKWLVADKKSFGLVSGGSLIPLGLKPNLPINSMASWWINHD